MVIRNFLKKYSYFPSDYSVIASNEDGNEDYDISIVVPSYQRTELMLRLLDSLSSQETVLKFEVVITEDTREENHITAIKSYLMDAPFKYKYIFNTNRLGLYPNWNQAISLSSGKYFMLVHTDDILHKHLLRSYENYINKGYAAICQKWKYLYPKKNNNEIQQFLEKDEETSKIRKVEYKDVFKGFSFPLLGAIISRTILDSIGFFPINEEWSTAEDYFYMTKIHLFAELYQLDSKRYGYIIEDNYMLSCEGWEKSIIECYFLRVQSINYQKKGFFYRRTYLFLSKIKAYIETKKRMKWMKNYSVSKEIINEKGVYKKLGLNWFDLLISRLLYCVKYGKKE